MIYSGSLLIPELPSPKPSNVSLRVLFAIKIVKCGIFSPASDLFNRLRDLHDPQRANPEGSDDTVLS